MNKLVKDDEIIAICNAHYAINKFTTNHGALIFAENLAGDVSNSVIYRKEEGNSGHHIDVYLDIKRGFIKSIWFVSIQSEVLYFDEQLSFDFDKICRIPFFDISMWGNENVEIWSLIRNDNFLEIYHNGEDLLYLSFGESKILEPLNNNVLLQYDDDYALTGIVIKDGKEIPKLLDALFSKR